MNLDKVIPNLWIGSAPEVLPRNFDAIVFAAAEIQPDFGDPPEQLLLYAPLLDEDIAKDPEQRWWATQTAERVAHLVRTNRRVLVTCNQGWNRSGLITALALRFLDYSTEEAIRLVRAARGEDALGNPSFVKFLEAA